MLDLFTEFLNIIAAFPSYSLTVLSWTDFLDKFIA